MPVDGTSTTACIPARAAYAASDADVLPVLAQIATRAPVAAAREIATVMPASLNEAVGFMPRCKHVKRSMPPYAALRGASKSGTSPSRSAAYGGMERLTCLHLGMN